MIYCKVCVALMQIILPFLKQELDLGMEFSLNVGL